MEVGNFGPGLGASPTEDSESDEPGMTETHNDVLWHGVRALLGTNGALNSDVDGPFYFREAVELKITLHLRC